MLKRQSLSKQFSYTFFLIILCTLLTLFIEIVIFSIYILHDTKLLPANHYEKIVPRIENTVNENKEKVLEVSFEEIMNKIVPKNGIKYIVLDNNGQYVYGNAEIDIFPNKDTLEQEWVKRLNTQHVSSNVVSKYIPIMDGNNKLVGECAIQYELKVSYKNKDKITKNILWGIILSPFIIVVVFTVIFGRKLSKNIKEPLGILTEAAEKIKNNNLDFHINYPYKNELGDAVTSFEDMRSELHKTLNKQWKLEDEKNLMISAISHDLRTPLTIIKGHAEMLNDGAYKKEDRLLKYLRSIENSSDWAVALLNDMNTLIKIENVDFKLNKEKVDIYKFIENKVKEYESLTNDKNIMIKVECWDEGNLEKEEIGKQVNNESVFSQEVDVQEVDVQEVDGVDKHIRKYGLRIKEDGVKGGILKDVMVDKLRVSQVIDNIITNSIRYTPDGGIITVRINAHHERLNIAIEDSGSGFSNEDLKMALEKFYRGDKSRGSGSGHSGLGLYISRKLINLHDGQLRIYNNKNGGAGVEFFIYQT
ncbi:HAMP domain-containing sensor histidine kinase [Oceanirhabdus sp. W0125-5]|uniref:HAMP domain-containing sensor histidine kinase n=1 Tax=Oceanirhabdus sp. W0125-5 TaxID=2999116 RepID=UPI0022F308A6|nr:HAMP domain-containing sensor histidine kinase [Oceanirhabdus sp. W0125-5]WBW97016.1 HAMP domain-containing sensor histidine kinase [Oceanirhabdus sp. W0125-5]